MSYWILVLVVLAVYWPYWILGTARPLAARTARRFDRSAHGARRSRGFWPSAAPATRPHPRDRIATAVPTSTAHCWLLGLLLDLGPPCKRFPAPSCWLFHSLYFPVVLLQEQVACSWLLASELAVSPRLGMCFGDWQPAGSDVGSATATQTFGVGPHFAVFVR
jgi:hypothetical protein